MAFDISPSIIFMGVTGSHAYGTARKTSDVDVRGCCIAPRRYRLSPFRKFEQATDSDPKFWGEAWKPLREGLEAHPTASQSLAHDPDQTLDIVAYDVAKLVKLCRLTNPNMLELLFLEEQDIIISSSLWERLSENRDLFLSKAVKHSYCGYAHSQLKRIKGHRAWLLNPPKKKPTREDFDLPETTVLGADIRNRLDEAIKKIVRDWGVEDGLDDYIKGAAQDVLRERVRDFQATMLQCKDDMLDDQLYELGAASLGLSKDVLYALKQERSYRAALKDYKQYETWKRERNPVRAEMEAKFGYDCKHAAHLIRLLRTGSELLRGEGLKVRRDDAEELLAIRNGSLSYDELIEMAERLDQDVAEAYKTSALPHRPNEVALETLLIEVLDQFYQTEV